MPRTSSGGGTGKNAEYSSPLSAVCHFWKEFDLESIRSKLDEVGLKIAEQQEEAMQNRRKLADSTREFKRSTTDAITRQVGGLLKQYQEEIDRLTKRAKHGESAFLELYQKLFEAPDPAPALSLAFETTSRVTELETINKKLAQELAEYKAESTQIKNQDLTIRKLEEKIRALEAQMEEKDEEIKESKETAAAEADAAIMDQMQQREQQLTQMLQEAQASLTAMQRLHHSSQNQLFTIQSQTDEERVSRQNELELTSAELERAQERLLMLENETTRLQAQLLSKRTDTPSDAKARSGPPALEEALRQELSTQREVSSRLRSEVAALKRELEEVGSMWAAKVEGLKSTLAAQEQHSQALEQELEMRPTVMQVEELKQQIRILQAVGYNTVELDDGGPGASGSSRGPGQGPNGGGSSSSSGGASGRPAGSGGSLEAMLLSKNRHLEHELTMARLKAVDSKQELDTALAQVAELESELEQQRRLVAQLEEDLAAAGQASEADSSNKPGGGAAATRQLSGLLGSNPPAEEESSSMVRVLCAQRDRFRQRAQELEEEGNRLRSELQAANNEAAAARADNVALVERLRYVHGYRQQGVVRKDVESGVEAEKRYGKLYEEGINPFKEFQGQQRERQKKQLNLADRAMYHFGQLVFGSQAGRLATFLYLLLLHLLVFMSMSRMMHHGSHQLYSHQQQLLRHDLTASMHHHHEHSAAAAAATQAAVKANTGLP